MRISDEYWRAYRRWKKTRSIDLDAAGRISGNWERAGCAWLLSEDFQAGRKFGPVTVVNPFLWEPAEFGLTRPRRSS